MTRTNTDTFQLMLADKAAICSLARIPGQTVTGLGGALELAPDVLEKLAKGAADRFGGTVVRTWHDHHAGGVFALVEVAGA